jgi:hypothetical protein
MVSDNVGFSGSEGSTAVVDAGSHTSCPINSLIAVDWASSSHIALPSVQVFLPILMQYFPLQSQGFETVRQFQLALCLYEFNYILSCVWVTNNTGFPLDERVIYSLYTSPVITRNYSAIAIPTLYNSLLHTCRQQAEVIQNHENANIRNIGQGVQVTRLLL